MKRNNGIKIVLLVAALLVAPLSVSAQQTVQVTASQLLPHVDVSFAPMTGTFTEGSTFQVQILSNTKGASINGIDFKINFDASKLSIIQPSNGKSIIGVWVEPPVYDNTKGTATFVGVIPNGVTTSSGLIGTITFLAKQSGTAALSFRSNSSVLLNDGLGSTAVTTFGRGAYTIIPKPPEGVLIHSETHPSSDTWYNNKNPVFTWDKETDVSGFSYVLDDKPTTIPENTVLTTDAVKAYQDVADGLWYFHVKAIKKGVWGTTGTYLVRIDSTPPADFKPEANYVVAALAMVERTLISFVTTDNLSGVDHYEVGVIDITQPTTASPVFTRTESPFQIPLTSDTKLHVIVRAIDGAGNVRDAAVDIHTPFIITQFVKDYLTYILGGILLLAFLMLLMHYLFGHKILAHIRRAFAIVKEEEQKEESHAAAVPVQSTQNNPKNPDDISSIS